MTTNVLEEADRLIRELEAEVTDIELREAGHEIFAYTDGCVTDTCGGGGGGGSGDTCPCPLLP
jgi:hypothetical protein